MLAGAGIGPYRAGMTVAGGGVDWAMNVASCIRLVRLQAEL